MTELVEMISHGGRMEDLKILQDAIEFKGKLPKHYFWADERLCETLGEDWRSKKELKELRQNIIDEIIQVIYGKVKLPRQRKLQADHYARYLHALTILKFDKNLLVKTHDTGTCECPIDIEDKELREQVQNEYLRNAFLDLWRFDDGSEEAKEAIISAGWYISEIMKSLEGTRGFTEG